MEKEKWENYYQLLMANSSNIEKREEVYVVIAVNDKYSSSSILIIIYIYTYNPTKIR